MTGYPEGNKALKDDDELRSMHKFCSALYDSFGDCGPTYFPEGSKPLPSDNEERIAQKITAILNAQ